MGLSTTPIVSAGAIASADAELIELGREFTEIAAQLDAAIEDPTKELSYAVLDRLGQINEKILATQSQTIEGLCVKARAACWARLGDLDYSAGWSDGGDMAWSIIRDLIRLYDPHLEHPGAMTRLVEKIEL